MLPFDDQFEELNQPESAIAPSPSDQVTLSPKLDSKDDEDMSEASTLLISIPLSLLSVTLPQGDVVQHADQLEGQQLLEGE